MKYYQQLQLLPDAEISVYFLWERVYAQVHLALADAQQDNVSKIGISFPEYNAKEFQLGDKLRLFASTEAELNQLNLKKWLNRLTDYVHLSSVRIVPDAVNGYAVFKRQQRKSNNERLARRKAKRENITYEEALTFLNGRMENTSKLPFIYIKSLSSQQRYPLFIACEQVQKATNSLPIFNTYGLSSNHALPMF